MILLANHDGDYRTTLDNSAFDLILAEITRRGVPLLIHPSALPEPEAQDIPPYVADYLLDTTRAAIGLVMSGVFRRYPKLKIILANAGGFVPYSAHRFSSLLNALHPEIPLSHALSDFKKFYYELAMSATPSCMPSLQAVADPSRILFGTDFPYAPAQMVKENMKYLAACETIDHKAIFEDNARALFPRFKK